MLHLHIKDTNGNGYIFTVWLLFTHCVERSKKKKKTHTTLIFVHDIGLILTEIAGLGVCGTVTTGSHLFYSNISYSMFGLLCCV